jgi:hypothetical protein
MRADPLAPPSSPECRVLFGQSHLAPYHNIASDSTMFVAIVCPKYKIRICEWFDSAALASSVYSFVSLNLPARQFNKPPTVDPPQAKGISKFCFCLYRHPPPAKPGEDVPLSSVDAWDRFRDFVDENTPDHESDYGKAMADAYLDPTKSLHDQNKASTRLILHLIVPRKERVESAM